MSSLPLIFVGYAITSSDIELSENPLVYSWFICVLFNSIYTFYWDIKYDWGLFEKDFHYLRAQLLFSRSFYWLAIIIDFTIRFFWLINTLFMHWNLWDNNIGVVLECLELFRRWLWVFLRIEKELVYRASYINPLPKLNFAK